MRLAAWRSSSERPIPHLGRRERLTACPLERQLRFADPVIDRRTQPRSWRNIPITLINPTRVYAVGFATVHDSGSGRAAMVIAAVGGNTLDSRCRDSELLSNPFL